MTQGTTLQTPGEKSSYVDRQLDQRLPQEQRTESCVPASCSRDSKLFVPSAGVPQGGVISPVLFNIYVNKPEVATANVSQ